MMAWRNGMTKLVINTCYGGFGLSQEAWRLYAIYNDYYTRYVKDAFGTDSIELSKSGNFDDVVGSWDLVRNDPTLVRVVEQLGTAANDYYSDLKIIEIPEDVVWELNEYDGREWISEVHRRWS
jgi:hypothetical protein